MKITKKVMSIFLVIVTLFTIIPFSAFAQEDRISETQHEVSYGSNNVLGDIVTDAINETESSKTDENGINYFIQDVEIVSLEATVNLYAPDGATLVVAVYDENNRKMLTTGKTSVDSETETAKVELADCEMPEYFMVSAFLLDGENAPLCEKFETQKYTQAFQEFLSKTTEDFEEEKVINLDYGIESNFAVVSDDAIIAEQTETENILTTNDFDNGRYVFENATSDIASLSVNDVLFFRYGDGAEDYVLTKVGSIENKNGTVTITTTDDYEIGDFFSYIKIDSSEETVDKPSTYAMARGFDEDQGKEDESDRYNITPFSFSFKSGDDKEDPDKTVVADKDVNYDITLSCVASFVENYVKFYYDIRLFGKDAYEFEYNLMASFQFQLEIEAYGTVSVTFYGLKDATIPILPGLGITITVKTTLSLTANVSATGKVGFEISRGVQRRYDKRNNIDIEKNLNREIKPFINYDGKVEIKFSVEPVIEVGFKILKVFSAKVGIYGSLDTTLVLVEAEVGNDDVSVNGSGVSPDKRHGCEVCFQIETEVSISISFKIAFNITKDEDKEKIIVNINLLNVSVPIGTRHLSCDNGKWNFAKGECENYQYKVTFHVIDEYNQSFPGVNISTDDEEVITNFGGIAIMYLKPGSHKITLLAPDKTNASDYVVVSDEAEEVEIKIIRCKVTVTVTDADGNPISDAFVNGLFFTDANGKAEFYLAEGKHTITATYDDITVEEEITISFIDLEKKVDFTISKCKVKVIVKDENENLLKNADVDGYLTNSNGVAEFYLPKGTHTIKATYDGVTVYETVTIDKEKQMVVDIVIGKCKVTVTVYDKEGKPLPGAVVNSTYVTDSNGVVIIYLPKGSHNITAVSEDGETASTDITINVEKEMNVTISMRSVINSGECGDNLTWTLYDDGELVISGTGKMTDYTYTPPWSYRKDMISFLTIEDNVTTIGRKAFYDMSFIKVSIGNSVKTIGYESFRDGYIGELIISDSVTTIEDSAFAFCSIDRVKIPDSVITIGNAAFYSNSSLKDLTIGNSVTEIGVSAFCYCKNLTSVTIPDSVTIIGDYAFGYCENLTSVTIPDSVTIIGDYAFENCEKLTSVTIPDSVTIIGDYAFSYCENLTSVTIPDSVTTIGEGAFAFCNGFSCIQVDNNNLYYSNDEYGVLYDKDKTILLQYPIGNKRSSYKIPYGVITIADSAFYDCQSLTDIIIPDSVTTIGNSAFGWCYNLENITIPDSLINIGALAFFDTPFLADNINGENGTLYINNCLIDLSYSPYQTEFEIREGTVAIAGGILNAIPSLESITIPDSVTAISDYTFENCKRLTSVTIPDSVTTIGNSAFRGCYDLENITIPDSVKEIGDYAFFECESLESVKIPYGVTIINESTFYGCRNLESVTIPDSVTSIGDMAFAACFNLNTIYYSGTEAQWQQLSVDTGDATIICNSTGETLAYSSLAPKNYNSARNEILMSTTLTDAIIGNEYLMLIVRDENAEDLLDSSNLIYIDQQTADSTELLFIFNTDETNYSILFFNNVTQEHKHDYTSVVTAPACTEQGFTTYTCSECGDSYIDDYVDATGHTPGEWQVVKSAQIGVAGLEQQKCSVCDTVLNERTIPALEAPTTEKPTDKPTEKPTEPPTQKPSDKLQGDADGNGKITAADARLALRISAKLEKATELQATVADMDKNGKITAADARKILRISAKLE